MLETWVASLVHWEIEVVIGHDAEGELMVREWLVYYVQLENAEGERWVSLWQTTDESTGWARVELVERWLRWGASPRRSPKWERDRREQHASESDENRFALAR